MTIIFHGDCRAALKLIPDGTIQTIVTSPPYFGLRDYGVEGQLGLEPTSREFVATMVEVFREARRALSDDGTLWLNLGDSYANDTKWGGSTSGKHVRAQHGDSGIGRRRQNTGLKSKDLMGIPWRVAFALQEDGWYLRQNIIWHKLNPMPEAVRDRPTSSHEFIFLLTKRPQYYYDWEAIVEPVSGGAHARKPGPNSLQNRDRVPRSRKPGVTPKSSEPGNGIKANTSFHEAGGALVDFRNKRSVWSVASKPYAGAHFATFPPDLIRPCILAGAPVGGIVYDPFLGSGTTAAVAREHGRIGWGSELNPGYIELAKTRIGGHVDVVPV